MTSKPSATNQTSDPFTEKEKDGYCEVSANINSFSHMMTRVPSTFGTLDSHLEPESHSNSKMAETVGLKAVKYANDDCNDFIVGQNLTLSLKSTAGSSNDSPQPIDHMDREPTSAQSANYEIVEVRYHSRLSSQDYQQDLNRSVSHCNTDGPPRNQSHAETALGFITPAKRECHRTLHPSTPPKSNLNNTSGSIMSTISPRNSFLGVIDSGYIPYSSPIAQALLKICDLNDSIKGDTSSTLDSDSNENHASTAEIISQRGADDEVSEERVSSLCDGYSTISTQSNVPLESNYALTSQSSSFKSNPPSDFENHVIISKSCTPEKQNEWSLDNSKPILQLRNLIMSESSHGHQKSNSSSMDCNPRTNPTVSYPTNPSPSTDATPMNTTTDDLRSNWTALDEEIESVLSNIMPSSEIYCVCGYGNIGELQTSCMISICVTSY
jgi:hypothetical protein